MKITKSYLKQIIKEEISRIYEEETGGDKQVANFEVEYSPELGGSAQEQRSDTSGPLRIPENPPVFLAKITRIPMKDEVSGLDLPQTVYQIYKVAQKPGKYKNKEGRPAIEAYHDKSQKGVDWFTAMNMKGWMLVKPEATPEELQQAVDTVTKEISLKTTPRTAKELAARAAMRFSPRSSDQRAYKASGGGY